MAKKTMDNNIIIDDENPEWTDEMFAKARPAREVLEKDFGKENAEKILKGKGGRPVAESPKPQVTIRMDADILAEFRSHGKGWQTEINNILRQWVENRPQ